MTNTQLKEIKRQLEYLTTAYEQDDLIAIKKIALTMEYTIQVLIENTVEAIEAEDGKWPEPKTDDSHLYKDEDPFTEALLEHNTEIWNQIKNDQKQTK